jgi:hypothetical protein
VASFRTVLRPQQFIYEWRKEPAKKMLAVLHRRSSNRPASVQNAEQLCLHLPVLVVLKAGQNLVEQVLRCGASMHPRGMTNASSKCPARTSHAGSGSPVRYIFTM